MKLSGRTVVERHRHESYWDIPTRSGVELRLLEATQQSEFLVPLGWYADRWWYVGPLHCWAPRTFGWHFAPDWSKGYACWHHPVGWVTATCGADVQPWRDNARLKRTAEELTEQATADQVADALMKLNENLGYGGVWR